MEEPEADWETHEGYDDDGWEDRGKMGWVLDKGLDLGKRILVTGFVMTSAPIVLPPVLFITAIGFVCSVPYGFFLASYACTEKLMSKLLPVPTTNAGHDDDTGLEYWVHDDDVGSTFRQREFGRGKQPLFRALDFDTAEKEQKKNVGESMYREGDKPTGETNVVGGLGLGEGEGKKVWVEEISGGADNVLGVVINIEGDEKLGGNAKGEQVPFEVTSISIDLCEAPAGYKEDEMVKETRGLIEKMRDEGIPGGKMVEEKQMGTDKNASEVAHGSAGTEEPVAIADQNVEQNGKKARGFPESKKDDAIQQEEKKSQGAKGNKSRKGKAKGGKQAEAKKEKEVSGAGDATTTPAGLHQNADSDKKGGRVISSYAVHKMSDPLKIAISPGGYDLTQTKITQITPADSVTTSYKELYTEEQIWKQIDAVRKIVGYTTPRHETCIEELKALYIVTGVEPPTSFKDLSGLVEVNHKLRFLMSIVGVK